jgi:uncharacterized protein (DUF983 family)
MLLSGANKGTSLDHGQRGAEPDCGHGKMMELHLNIASARTFEFIVR